MNGEEGALTDGKLVRIIMLNVKEIIWQGIKVSFVVHFCFGIYSYTASVLILWE